MRSIVARFLAFGALALTASALAQTSAGPDSLSAIRSRAEFDSLARVYTDANVPLAHVLFVIDRQQGNRIYYINSKRYRFHRDFVNGTYLSLERGQDFFDKNYLKPNRRFILGTLAYQTPIKRWTFEFWEGDQINAELIALAAETIRQTFFEPVAFKPNSTRQEQEAAKIAGLDRVSAADILREQEYQPLNVARGIGRIHIIKKLDEHTDIHFNEIVVLDEVPLHLPPVAGIIVSKPSTPLSHVNLLAKSWGVPNAYIKNATELLKEYDGWWVTFETKPDAYAIKRAGLNRLDEYQRRLQARRDIMTPRFDLATRRLARLDQQRATDVVRYGAKSANLGEVIAARIAGIVVPRGFTIPFFYYDQFVRENGLDEKIYGLLNDQRFVHDPAYRREQLAALRERFRQGRMNARLRALVLARVRREFRGAGLFVRSSTNSEDLPNFNGAGLYTTVPNVRTEEQLIDAIKTVWGSVWNFEAYEARERAGIDHSKVFMAVIIQEGINADSAGVMITTDPFNAANRDAVYISAKRGLGIKVVEGQKIAEQVIYRPATDTIQILTRSEEDSLLTFDERGGVKEVPITGERTVLTDEMARRLARVGLALKRTFGGRDQDIEWAYLRGQLYIVQSRPYIAGGS